MNDCFPSIKCDCDLEIDKDKEIMVNREDAFKEKAIEKLRDRKREIVTEIHKKKQDVLQLYYGIKSIPDMDKRRNLASSSLMDELEKLFELEDMKNVINKEISSFNNN